MNLIQQPILIASTATDNSVGMGVMLVMFAVIVSGVALRALNKRARGQWLTFGRRHRRDHAHIHRVDPCDGCPADQSATWEIPGKAG
jgi:hypothetical protein